MKTSVWFWLLTATGMISAAMVSFATLAGTTTGEDDLRKQLQNTYNQGNYKDAYDGFRKLALDPRDNPSLAGHDLDMAVQCLQRLNRIDEIDALLEETIDVHKENWRLLWRAAQECINIPDQGYIVAGKFSRGNKRGGGNMVNAANRDRVRALQLMVQAMPLAMKDENHAEAGDFLLALADMLLNNRGYYESWRLQYLTDLKALPDYDEGWGYRRETSGAPVDADGRPVFYPSPKSFDTAENDGQRWRWCLEQAAEMNPNLLGTARMRFAEFLQNQFGVQTMAQWGWRFGRMETDDTKEDESGTYALHTLGENETIARLATGVKRFELPEEFNYIKIFQEIAAKPQADYAVQALEQLAQIFENRRQYDKAAKYWRQLLKDFPSQNVNRRKGWQQRLDQIVGNWGRFEPAQTQPAGQGATVEYRFRNGRQLDMTAREIKVEKLLDDVKAFLKSNPRNISWEKINIGDIGYRLVQRNQKKYVGREVAQWRMELKPRENHFDKRVTVATPLQKPGAYLVEARMADGNTSFIVLWVDDTAIVKKPLSGKTLYYVADAVSGKPVAKANVEFFGWRQIYHDKPSRHEVIIKQFAEFTNADGQVIPDPQSQIQDMQWLIIARNQEGRFAYLGFTGVWYGDWYDAQYSATKVYTITDRPVYRPDQKVKHKFWIRHAQYDMADTSEFANRDFTVEIRDPKGDKIVSEVKKTDAYGGIEGEYSIPAGAALGVYSLNIKDQGGGSFRVEEYKKPEFEVTVDAPTEPVMLGEKITATIKAKYYFGSPVTKAKVKYKVNRSSYDQQWYPLGPWDWLYGPGYWWYGYDYHWYPGWRSWGCLRPTPFWWPHQDQPPELIADQEVEIGEDGMVKVEIDTAVAKAIYPNEDQSYSITAEVVDQSRRTIVGTGTVLVAKKPFSVYAWLQRGYYRVGDTIKAHFSARALDGKPIEGHGELQLFKISYKDGKPVETPVQTWQLDTNSEGMAHQPLAASQAGQYRLSYKLTQKLPSPAGRGAGGEGSVDSSPNSPHPNPLPKGEGTEEKTLPKGEGTNEHTIEGGYVFTIIGEGFDGTQFRFNNLELLPDKREYAPGEKVKLQINTDRAGGTVLLFVRPANGVYLPPKVIRLDGKSTIEEIGVIQKDMPNFFVEAVTVADGQVYTETKEIVVPPEKRVLNVEIEPLKLPSPAGRGAGGEGDVSSDEQTVSEVNHPHPSPLPKGEGTMQFRPGEKAKVKLKLTDLAGKAFVGSTVVSIYDKSVEYISGGSNVPEIKEFFWKWRREHHPTTDSSLGRWCQNLISPKSTAMGNLGIFGGEVTDGCFGGPVPEKMMMGGMVMKSAARAMDGAMPMAAPAMAMADSKEEANGMGGGGEPTMVEPTVRSNFADTALWVGDLTTDQNGTAEVSLDMPENLTTWRIKVWGMGQGTRVGQGQTDVVTRKDLIIRMQAPRFFVQSDEVVLSAIVHNYLKSKKSVNVALEFGNRLAAGTTAKIPLTLLDGQKPTQTVTIEPNGETRVDWRVKVLDEGEAVVRMKALTDEESDAMEQKFPCYIHGMLKMESFSGSIRPKQDNGKFTIDVPKDRRPADSRLEVRFSPTLAGAMVDALPYLVDYPYGCTEQTLNRFLPTVITQKVLLEMNLNLKEIEQKRTNLNAQEIGDDAERAKQWGRIDPSRPHPNPLPKGEGTIEKPLPKGEGTRNPVFDEEEVRRMVKDGVARLTEMQCSDGGWGWFSGWGEYSSPHTTALVVHGLQIAQQNDVALVPGVLERGVEWLKRQQNEQVQLLKNAAIKDKPENLRWKDSADNIDAFIYMVLVDAGEKNQEMLDFLYRDRTHLAVYGLAMYGIAIEKQGDREKLDMILKNIGQYVEQDDENQTAWLRLPDGFWWYWYGSEYEAHAYYLKLLSRTDPKGELAARIVKYLLNNRKNSTYWNSTRDTALCIEAMADFIRHSGEARPEMTVEVYYDGKLQKAVEITSANLFTFDNKFVIEGDAVETGRHTIELKRKGSGPLYYNGYQTTFTLEDFIKRAGLEVKVNRKYYKLVKADKSIKAAGSHGQAVDQKVEKYDRQELPNLSVVKSGDLVEIELEIDSKNDYEYLIFEDMKPAGFEPVEVRSGYTDNDLGAYVEFRDNRVVFFARALARGKHSVSYRMRAEIPGKFSALPTRAAAMYAPELKGNSDELKIEVEDY